MYIRCKCKGQRAKEAITFIVNGDFFPVLMEYINHFPVDKRKGRFFVKLSESSGLPTQNIGKNMLGTYPKPMAEALYKHISSIIRKYSQSNLVSNLIILTFFVDSELIVSLQLRGYCKVCRRRSRKQDIIDDKSLPDDWCL